MDGTAKIPDDASADSGLLSVRILGFLLGSSPSRGHQLGDSGARPVPGQLGNHVAKVREGIDIRECAIVQHRADDRVSLSALVGATEQVAHSRMVRHGLRLASRSFPIRRPCSVSYRNWVPFGLRCPGSPAYQVPKYRRLKKLGARKSSHGLPPPLLPGGRLGMNSGIGSRLDVARVRRGHSASRWRHTRLGQERSVVGGQLGQPGQLPTRKQFTQPRRTGLACATATRIGKWRLLRRISPTSGHSASSNNRASSDWVP
jgi:hypothetical protein